MAEDIIGVAVEVARALDDCGVAYSVGGSLASGFSGEPRFTLDIDIVVALGLEQVKPLVARLGPAFYADADAIARAVRERSSVNLIVDRLLSLTRRHPPAETPLVPRWR